MAKGRVHREKTLIPYRKRYSGNKELGELWSDVKNAIAKTTEGRTYNITQKKADVDEAIATNILSAKLKYL